MHTPEVARQRIVPINTGETHHLHQAIIGYAANLFDNPPLHGVHHNNPTQAQNATAGHLPDKQQAVAEFAMLQDVLEQHGVEVLTQDPCRPETGVQSQMTVRDVGIGIDDTFIVANLFRPNRKGEIEGIQKFIDRMPPDRVVDAAKHNVIVEGGNVIVDKGCVFVGENDRTTPAATDFLAKHTSKKVVRVPLNGILHLDCGFMPVGEQAAVISPDGITDIPSEIQRNYRLIPIDTEEQAALGSNFVSLSPDTIIVRDTPRLERINNELTRVVKNVIPVPFDQAPLRGGSLRCCVLPIVRQLTEMRS